MLFNQKRWFFACILGLTFMTAKEVSGSSSQSNELPGFEGFDKLKKIAKSMYLSPEWIEKDDKKRLVFYDQPNFLVLLVSLGLIAILLGVLLYSYFDACMTNFVFDKSGIYLVPGRHPSVEGRERIYWGNIKDVKYSLDGTTWGVSISLRGESFSRSKALIQRGVFGDASFESVDQLIELIKAYQKAYVRTLRGEDWYLELSTPLSEFGRFNKNKKQLIVFGQKPLRQIKKLLTIIIIILCFPLYGAYRQGKPYLSKSPICTMDQQGITDHRNSDNIYHWEKVIGPHKGDTLFSYLAGQPSNNSKSDKAGIQSSDGELLFSEKNIPLIFFYNEVTKKVREGVSPLE
ncbi:MAG: hypothetical protein AAF335_02790 [Bacteroidota bacterium]